MKKKRLVYGYGINDADYVVQPSTGGKCPYYVAWSGMLRRAYSQEMHSYRPTYIKCTVSEEWLLFTNFKTWMEKQDWKGKQLDKDILIKGNKHYSKDNCIFVDRYINSILLDGGSSCKNRKLPIGVRKKRNVFTAGCSYKDKNIYLGSFESVGGARKAYINFKSEKLKEIINSQKDKRLINALERELIEINNEA